MKKHTAAVGPTGPRPFRSLLAFRHHNPLARLLSTVVAFAIAMLLVASTGPAYADDPAPTDPSVTTTDTPAPDPSADAPATGDPAPATQDPAPAAQDPAPATQDAAPADAPTAEAPTAKGHTGSGPMMSTLTKLASPTVTPALTVTVPCIDGIGTLVGNFEIDGDLCAEGHQDWDSAGVLTPPAGDTANDGFGTDDHSVFTEGTSEGDDPANWTVKDDGPNGKTDIGQAWAYSKSVNGTVYGYFALTNDSTSGGTSQYDVEYNRLGNVTNGNGALVPNRTPADPANGSRGDLLFRFSSTGSDPIVFTDAKEYKNKTDASWDNATCEPITATAGWCTIPKPANAFTQQVTDDGTFFEAALNISLILGGPGTCSPVFGTVNIRSVTGNQFYESALKDYVRPLNVRTPSNCGSLVIEKRDETGALVGGATFTISEDPRPGHSGPVTVKDGAGLATPVDVNHPAIADPDGTADGDITFGEAEPGPYTVTETSPPSSDYFIDAPLGIDTNPQSVTSGNTATFRFTDHHIWKPLTISKDAAGTFGATYHWKINKLISPTGEDGTWVDGTKVGDPLVKNVEAGDDTHLFYKLVVTEDGFDASDYVVKGTIHVGNDNPDTWPNDGAVDATITESLDGCKLDSNSKDFPVDVTVPSGGADYAYTCTLPGPIDEPATNTATVTWDKSDYPQTLGDLDAPDSDPFSESADSDPFSFVETAPVNKTVTITDDTGDLAPGWTLTYGVGGPSHESAVYKYDPAPDPGTCSDVITNTATVLGDDDVTPATQGDGNDAVDSENGQVCVEDDLAAAVVNMHESLTRTFNWDIHKSTTTPPPATITVANGQATAHYLVDVEALPYDDSDWAMTGTVHITNPNLFTDKQVSSLDISYAGGGTCAPDGALPDVAADDSADVPFTCTFGDPAVQPAYDGDVTATVKWDADAESIAADKATVAESDWVITPVDEWVKVFDDHAVPGTQDPLFSGTQLRWQDVYDSTDPTDHQVEVEYDHTFSGSILPAAGSCKDLTNTAWLTVAPPPEVLLTRAAAAPENALASDDATVRVCTPAIIVSPPVPPEVSPPGALPNTGGPDAWALAAGLVLLLGGSSLVIGDRRRRRRS